ncbi:hypothetical protein NSA53_18015 [Cellulosimicrobium cellulans]|uniref:hypothetical protein n=1 Tax=Cellulosimicrobium cellulans TaxID=1710 RepID=UPI002149BC30|nr:hypothetical protein [Cellulosimicrobium cellulans]
MNNRPYQTRVTTPAAVYVGIILLALGLLAAAFDGGAGPLLIIVGAVVTIIGFVTRARRRREALDFEVQLMLQAADDPDD